MCGIIGYTGKNIAEPILIEGLTSLEYRGYDSTGIATLEDGQIKINKSKGRIENLKNKLVNYECKSKIGIGHTRWATHGAPSDQNSHPHYSNDKSIALVHNGIIENYLELKENLIKKGYTFNSETDTEVVVHMIYDTYKNNKNLVEAVWSTIEKLEGAFSLGIICKDYPDQIICVKKDSPLIIGIGENENFIASDMPAILKYTRNTYLLEDGELAIIKPNEIEIFDESRNPIKKEVFKVDWDIEGAEKGGFAHFMLKEIFEQPKVIKDNISRRLKKNEGKINLEDINLNKEILQKINKIYIVACGTAYYAGLVGKSLIEKLVKKPVQAEVASEFRYKDPILDKNTLVIVVSQSGETADTLAAMRLAKSKGARVLAVVNAVGSTIAREADDVFYTLAGPEIAVASTKAFTAQVISMYLITFSLALELGFMTKEELIEIQEELEKMPSYISEILDKSDEIKALADKYANSKNVFYIGRGLDNIISLEGSLKLKEVAYVHSESYPAGELKHGPIALIEESTLVVGLLTQENVIDKTFSNLKEVKARGAKVLAIAIKGNEEVLKEAEDTFYIPKVNWMFAPILANIVQQLFAYYTAINLGTDVDKPRNLAKSVTVE